MVVVVVICRLYQTAQHALGWRDGRNGALVLTLADPEWLLYNLTTSRSYQIVTLYFPWQEN